MPKLLFTAGLLILTIWAHAQTITLSGSVSDTAEKRPLANATVSLLRATDSMLVKFTRTAPDGSFRIAAPKAGRFVILITYPGYADYADIQELTQPTDLGPIALITRAVLLQTVIVRGSAVRMKGDTLAFMADSFKVQPGATVEDLLRVLPGISVNSKGEITAQGQKVERVLVDGDEFFGDDPTLATRNLQSMAVKEVQVFDRKSDQANFTGVDDGQTQKTINLKLKDDFKKGFFGKIKLGGGLPNRWENQAMINAFKDKRKLSFYGVASNTNNNALGWSEEEQFGGNMNTQTEIGDDGSIMMFSSGDEFGGVGGFYGEGLPTSLNVGTSYANKWNENRSSTNAAYRFQRLKTEALTSNITQYILPDTQYFNNQRGVNLATRWRHKAQARTELFIDSMQSLTLTMNGSYGQNQVANTFNSQALTSKGLPVNSSERRTTSQGNQAQFNVTALYKLKFKKPKRTLSVNLGNNFNQQDSEGFLFTANDFFINGQMIKQDTVDQLKTTFNKVNAITSRIAYTEPVGKNGVIELSYGYNTSHNAQERLSYDAVDGKYTELNDRFSNDFLFKSATHRPGLGYRYNFKNWNFGFGSDVGFTNWNQEDRFRDTTRAYSFVNAFPRANLSYKLGQYSRIRFNYNGNMRAPSLNQLQPVADNTDPLNIYIGNPNLKQSFAHRFEVNYNFWQVLSNKGMWASLSFNPTTNAFSTFDTIDSLGRRVNQTVNVNGNYNAYMYMGYNFRLEKAKLGFDFHFNPSINRFTNFVNGRQNITQSNNWRFGFNVNRNVEKKYYAGIYQNFGYNTGKSSIRPDVITRFWTSETNFDITLQVPKTFTITSNAVYNWRQRTSVFENNNNALIWNIGVEKKVHKKEDLRVGFRVNDILNQNIGFRRNVNANYIQENTYNVIRRYWLVTLHWNFNKGPQKVESDDW